MQFTRKRKSIVRGVDKPERAERAGISSTGNPDVTSPESIPADCTDYGP